MNKRTRDLLWLLRRKVQERFWSVSGGQNWRVFGEDLVFTPETQVPSYRKLSLPKTQANKVRYTSFVELHALWKCLQRVASPITVIEVGAYQGVYAVLMGSIVRHKGGGTVLAIEPNPYNFRTLEANVRLNSLQGIVKCLQLAVLDMEGEVKVSTRESQSCVGATSEGVDAIALSLGQVIKEFCLEAVDLLLIDVEGAELRVLQGIPWQQIEIGRVFCEMHPYNWHLFGHDAQDVTQFLRDHGLICIDAYLGEHEGSWEQSYVGPTILVRSKYG